MSRDHWYRAGWGRYTQADPLEFKGGINLFAYALENPLRYKDPLGLKVYRCCAPADVAGGLVNHCWIKTDKQQTQIGFANEGQPAGTDPVWEFVRNEFEPADDAQIVGFVMDIDVLGDAFREALKVDRWQEPKRKGEPVHQVRYGSVPAGYKQTIPQEGLPILESNAAYRAVVFSSLGSTSAVFRL